MKIKLVSLDVDGTLYPIKGKPLDPRHVEIFQSLVKKLYEKGITPIIMYWQA